MSTKLLESEFDSETLCRRDKLFTTVSEAMISVD